MSDTAPTPPPANRLRGSRADKAEVVIPALLYVVAALLGVTWSSLGVAVMHQDPQQYDDSVIGTPRELRSDEWLTQTTTELNTLAVGHSSHSPLAESPDTVFQLSSGGVAESILFAGNNLLRLGAVFPDSMLFAATRLLPLLLLLLTLPVVLRRLGASRPSSWLGVALVVLAPTSVWWSYTPVRIAASASVASYLLLAAANRFGSVERGRWRWPSGVLLAAAGGVFAAQLGTYYVPWCISIGLPLLVAVAAALVFGPSRRNGLLALGIGVGTGVAVLGGTMLENWAALQATLDTVYPGQRRTGGARISLNELLGASGLFPLQTGIDPVQLNGSELASAYTVCGVWALVLLTAVRFRSRQTRAAAAALAGVLALWTTWCTLNWGGLGAHVPGLNLVPPHRMGQTLGYPAAMLLAIVLGQVPADRLRRWTPVVAGLLCGGLSAIGAAHLRTYIPQLSPGSAIASGVLVGMFVALVTRLRARGMAVVAATLVLLAPVATVNPIMFGLGEWRTSHAADQARALARDARAADVFVAADSPYLSSLLLANGVPMVSGFQTTGPDAAAWRILDPGDTFREQWNRGASYLWTTFDAAPGQRAWVTNPNGYDIISLHLDPCSVDTRLGIRYFVSSQNLKAATCLTEVSRFRWSGVTQRVYESSRR